MHPLPEPFVPSTRVSGNAMPRQSEGQAYDPFLWTQQHKADTSYPVTRRLPDDKMLDLQHCERNDADVP